MGGYSASSILVWTPTWSLSVYLKLVKQSRIIGNGVSRVTLQCLSEADVPILHSVVDYNRFFRERRSASLGTYRELCPACASLIDTVHVVA